MFKSFQLKKFFSRILSGLVKGLGVGLGLVIISLSVYLVLAVAPGTTNPVGPPPGNDVSWAPLYVDPANNRVGIANPTPNFALDVTGGIHASQDICSDASGGKCLSTVGGIPSGMIAMFDTNCPAGWTRFSALDNRVPLGDINYGGSGGSATHTHSFNRKCGVTGGGGAWCYVTDASVSANNLPPYLAVIWCKKD